MLKEDMPDCLDDAENRKGEQKRSYSVLKMLKRKACS
jgi:hypothetical protein